MRCSRGGFAAVELLACVGTATVLAAVGTVAAGSTGSPRTGGPQPPSADQGALHEINAKLDGLIERFGMMEGRLESIEKQLSEGQKATRDALRNARNTSAQLKDATQTRGVIQALVIWSHNNQDRFTLPSMFDKEGFTVGGDIESKDTTANIFSMLVFNGFVSTELCVSPAEVSPSIKVCETYEFNNPKAAVNGENALWDPAFSADFTGGKTGNLSYGHWMPFGERLGMWSSTFLANQAVVGNRGPEVTAVTSAGGAAIEQLANPASNTLRIHGALDKWEGNIAYGDAHVDFETTLSPRGDLRDFKDAQGKKHADCLFFDEPADPAHRNNYLGIFTSAGKQARDWKSIWD